MNIERARQLRRDATGPEREMWRLLYPLRQIHNFRRQVPLGPYFLDFACHSLKLAIEIDGDTHGSEQAMYYDAARTRFIETQGYRVLRFTNDDVLNNAEGVFDTLARAIEETAP
ncbi:endonuclease domain-containing protein [Devosia sp. 2618]|uniref:endonuclease domain-containing protein n=1 Tax=Devosia sp. 2618 TaxID=3156454 RepID=UPI003396A9E8